MEYVRRVAEFILGLVKWIMILLFITVLVIVVIRFIGQRVILSKTDTLAISEIRKIELAGKEQKILVEAYSTEKPILIVLNDGLGIPKPFGLGYRGVYQKLSGSYITVQWDQYGFGANKGKISSVKEYIPMIDDLVKQLKSEFNQPVYILSYGYGTIISGLYGSEHPEEINGIISVSTFISNNEYINNYYNELITLDLTEEEKNAIEEYKTKNDNDSFEAITTIAKKYISDFQGRNTDVRTAEKNMTHLAISPDYNIINIYNVFTYKLNDSYKNLYNELETIDMNSIYENIAVKVVFTQGEKDRYVKEDKLSNIEKVNGNIQYYIYNNCGEMISDGNWENLYTILRDKTINK